jgi:hypothetical protein
MTSPIVAAMPVPSTKASVTFWRAGLSIASRRCGLRLGEKGYQSR